MFWDRWILLKNCLFEKEGRRVNRIGRSLERNLFKIFLYTYFLIFHSIFYGTKDSSCKNTAATKWKWIKKEEEDKPEKPETQLNKILRILKQSTSHKLPNLWFTTIRTS